MKKQTALVVQDIEISIASIQNEDYISLTDMTKKFGDTTLIKTWLRTRSTIEFLGVWEQLHNQNFNWVEFDLIKNASGSNSFALSVGQWVKKTNAIGLVTKTGRYGSGTFGHKDIAFEFGSWLSPEFKLYLIKEFQRLKEVEQKQLNKEWDVRRILSKVNYRIHTSAVKKNL